MEINGLKLPASFLEAVRVDKLKGVVAGWDLRGAVDAYGNPLNAWLMDVYESQDEVSEATGALSAYLKFDDVSGGVEGAEVEPGCLPDIADYSKVVCFGISQDGAPFCFDFRDNEVNPIVIWWDEICWRRVAPDFAAFLALLDH